MTELNASTLQVAGRAKSLQFVSATITGNGSEQATAHGLGATPDQVVIIPQVGVTSISEGAHDGTDVNVTVNNGGTYKILAVKSKK